MAFRRRSGFPQSRPGPHQVLHLQLAGKSWSGDWSLDGKELVLRSAYGCRRRALGRRRPERLAEDLLREILLAYANGDRPSYDC